MVVVLILLLLIRGNLWTNSREYIWTIEKLLMIKGTDLIIERFLVQLLCSSRLRKCWTSRVASAWSADLIRINIWTDLGRSMIIRTSWLWWLSGPAWLWWLSGPAWQWGWGCDDFGKSNNDHGFSGKFSILMMMMMRGIILMMIAVIQQQYQQNLHFWWW